METRVFQITVTRPADCNNLKVHRGLNESPDFTLRSDRNRSECALTGNQSRRFEVATFSRWPQRLIYDFENAESRHSGPGSVIFAQISFNWRGSKPENLKSSCSLRHKTTLWRSYHPLIMCLEIINLIISEVPSPTVLSLESRQCRCTSNSSAYP